MEKWFKEPHIIESWPTPDEGEDIGDFLKNGRSDYTYGYIVFYDNTPIGYIQYYYADQSTEKVGSTWPKLIQLSIGIDQFIDDYNYIGKGYGTVFIKEFINYLRIIEPKVHNIILDPTPLNHAAIRCYEKVGFKKIADVVTSYGPAILMRFDI